LYSVTPGHQPPIGASVMMLVVVMGIALSMTGRYWSTVAKREKEEELLFRGDQIKKGIEQYYK